MMVWNYKSIEVRIWYIGRTKTKNLEEIKGQYRKNGKMVFLPLILNVQHFKCFCLYYPSTSFVSLFCSPLFAVLAFEALVFFIPCFFYPLISLPLFCSPCFCSPCFRRPCFFIPCFLPLVLQSLFVFSPWFCSPCIFISSFFIHFFIPCFLSLNFFALVLQPLFVF